MDGLAEMWADSFRSMSLSTVQSDLTTKSGALERLQNGLSSGWEVIVAVQVLEIDGGNGQDERDGSGRRFRPLIGGKAISAVALLGHNAGPHKPFVSKFVCAQLQESCIPPISPNNLAGADLCIKILGIKFSYYPPAHL